MGEFDAGQWGVVLGASLAAAIMDAREGRIPNVLTFPLWIAGLARAGAGVGLAGLAGAFGVSVLLALPYLASFVLGRGGAGDAKLMAGIGTWLTLREAVIVFCCVALAGMVLAIVRIAAQGERKNTLSGMLASLYVLAVACGGGMGGRKLWVARDEDGPEGRAKALHLPYGIVIFTGVGIAAVGAAIWT